MARCESSQDSVLQLGEYSKLPDIMDVKALPLHSIKRRKGNQLLGFYGMDHHEDLTHPDYDKLRTEFGQFERRTRRAKRIIISEGRVAEAGEDEASSFKKGRVQSALVAFWAKRYDIPIISGEPEPHWPEAQVVASRFSRHDDPEFGKKLVFYYYSGRMLTQLALIPEKDRPKPEEYLSEWFQKFRDSWKWQDFDFSYDNFRTIHESLYETPFDPMNVNFFLDQTCNYGKFNTPVQQVAQIVNHIRDTVLAYTHLELLEPGITESFSQNTNDIGRYSIEQAVKKRKVVESESGEGEYSTFDCHGYNHSVIVAPGFERWGEQDTYVES